DPLLVPNASISLKISDPLLVPNASITISEKSSVSTKQSRQHGPGQSNPAINRRAGELSLPCRWFLIGGQTMAKKQTPAEQVKLLLALGKLDEAQEVARQAIITGKISPYDYPMALPGIHKVHKRKGRAR